MYTIDELLKRVAEYANVKPPVEVIKEAEKEEPILEKIKPEDAFPLRIHSAIALVNEDECLAEDLQRAAELLTIPSELLLTIQKMLCPNSSTKQELLDIADKLENEYSARLTAHMVRKSMHAYEISSMLVK